MAGNDEFEFRLSEEETLRQKLQSMTLAEIDTILAEISTETMFLQEQVKCDFKSYSPEDLTYANEKIAHLKRTVEILTIKITRMNEKRIG